MLDKQLLSDITTSAFPVIPDEEYPDTMATTVVPYLDAHRHSTLLDREETQKLYCEYYFTEKDFRGSVFISHGFSESCSKYQEVIYYFLLNGYNVCAIDHRGHGRSRNAFETDICHATTHINHFQFYVYDMDYAIENVLKTQLPGPYYLFAHSMGGCIASLYLEQHPGTFQKAILTAPMLEINTFGIPVGVVKAISSLNVSLGKGRELLPGQGYYSPEGSFEYSACTCEPRYWHYQKLQEATPEFQNGGGSFGWTQEAMKALDRLHKPSNCQKVTLPVLLFQAEHDDFVMPAGQDQFISNIPDGRIVFVPDSKHEIYMSPASILQYYWSAILDFLA